MPTDSIEGRPSHHSINIRDWSQITGKGATKREESFSHTEGGGTKSSLNMGA